MSSSEKGIYEYLDLGFGSRSLERNMAWSESQLSEILKAQDPCLVVIKPHAVKIEKIESAVESMMHGLGLDVVIKNRIKLSREHVFGLYGDLIEVMEQGEKGVEFVEGLVSSFVEEGESLVYVVGGVDSYKKMKVVKKTFRDIGSVDRYRNVMHTSDGQDQAYKEIAALLV